jgi:hypothetical protein
MCLQGTWLNALYSNVLSVFFTVPCVARFFLSLHFVPCSQQSVMCPYTVVRESSTLPAAAAVNIHFSRTLLSVRRFPTWSLSIQLFERKWYAYSILLVLCCMSDPPHPTWYDDANNTDTIFYPTSVASHYLDPQNTDMLWTLHLATLHVSSEGQTKILPTPSVSMACKSAIFTALQRTAMCRPWLKADWNSSEHHTPCHHMKWAK